MASAFPVLGYLLIMTANGRNRRLWQAPNFAEQIAMSLRLALFLS
jgi:hypothetical protein